MSGLSVHLRSLIGRPGRHRAPARAAVALLLLAGLAALLYLGRLPRLPAAAPDAPAPSAPTLAILPFEPATAEPGDSLFAAVLHHDVLADLARLSALRPIGPTSILSYAADAGDPARIARDLAARYVVEGRVGRNGDAVEVTARLTDLASGRALWQRAFEAPVADRGGLHRDITVAVVEAVTGDTAGIRTRLPGGPTVQPEAHEAYVRGRRLAASEPDLGELTRAIGAYERAVQLDPDHALAWTALARAHAAMYGRRHDRTTGRIRAAEAALRRAEALQPDVPELHLTRAVIAHWCHQDYIRAARELAAARAGLPGDPEVALHTGIVLRRHGDLDNSRQHFDRALEMEPRSMPVLLEAAVTRLLARDPDGALELADRTLQLQPGRSDALVLAARALLSRGQPDAARAYLESAAPAGGRPDAQVRFWLVTAQLHQRRFDEARALLEADTVAAYIQPNRVVPRAQLLGEVLALQGDTVAARTRFRAARDLLTARLANGRDDPRLYAALGRALAGMGEGEAATAAVNRAAGMVPHTREPWRASTILEDVAWVHAATGQVDGAVAVLERLLLVPSEVTVARLSRDPAWDPLRSHGRFRQLVAAIPAGSD
jgi:TolB-like protein/Tfp pilus assembly protein PilF